VDADLTRIGLLNNTIDRLKLKVKVIHADVTETGTWWDGVPFDRILIDAPCSATGVIRRHPDIKYLRTPEQLDMLKTIQHRMLETLWPLLKPGGRLVYVTCSILQQESDEQIASFANKYDDIEFRPIDAEWGIRSQFGRHTLPGHDETDGFYYSAMVKTS
jgi:16S rRNA (cytosine967-C5)-methyltransferase